MKFVLFMGTDTKWYFHILAANNEIVAVSEGYDHLRDATHTVDLLKTSLSLAPVTVRPLTNP